MEQRRHLTDDAGRYELPRGVPLPQTYGGTGARGHRLVGLRPGASSSLGVNCPGVGTEKLPNPLPKTPDDNIDFRSGTRSLGEVSPRPRSFHEGGRRLSARPTTTSRPVLIFVSFYRDFASEVSGDWGGRSQVASKQLRLSTGSLGRSLDGAHLWC